jgi:hypothetical protein
VVHGAIACRPSAGRSHPGPAGWISVAWFPCPPERRDASLLASSLVSEAPARLRARKSAGSAGNSAGDTTQHK